MNPREVFLGRGPAPLIGAVLVFIVLVVAVGFALKAFA